MSRALTRLLQRTRHQRLNKTADTAASMLMPLYDASGRPVPGFPPRVGYRAHLGISSLSPIVYGSGLLVQVETPLFAAIWRSVEMQATELMALVSFVGANPNAIVKTPNYYITPEDRAKSRAKRRVIHLYCRKSRPNPPDMYE